MRLLGVNRRLGKIEEVLPDPMSPRIWVEALGVDIADARAVLAETKAWLAAHPNGDIDALQAKVAEETGLTVEEVRWQAEEFSTLVQEYRRRKFAEAQDRSWG